MTATRLEVALPVTVAFVFGLASGLVVGHLVTRGGQVKVESRPPAAMPPAGMSGADGGAGPQAAADTEEEARRMLAVHEQLLAESPDDVHLLRTVGNAHAMLGENEKALEKYLRAEELARSGAAPPGELAQVLADRGVLLAEEGDVMKALDLLAEASKLDDRDVRSRMMQAYLYLVRVMPNPPPELDRREAVRRAELLLDEVLALQPGHPDATQFKQLIAGVRAGRMGAGGSGPPASRP